MRERLAEVQRAVEDYERTMNSINQRRERSRVEEASLAAEEEDSAELHRAIEVSTPLPSKIADISAGDAKKCPAPDTWSFIR